MKITNKTNEAIKVAVNVWTSDSSVENPGVYTIEPAQPGTWNRKDARGYVMNVTTKEMTNISYFVRPGEDIDIYANRVTANGLTLRPAADNKLD